MPSPGSAASLAARLSGDTDDESRDDAAGSAVPDLPRVEDPPDAVYVPTHREGMVHLPVVEAGEYALSPMVTFPHRFWVVTGDHVQAVEFDGDRGVHLMVTLWDRETHQVLPVDVGIKMRTKLDGELVDERAPWPMISQTMGFHFGDNLPLPEDGTYTVDVDLNPITIRKTGAFADRFTAHETVTFEFKYDEAFRTEVVNGIEYLDEEYWGQRGALEPPTMHHDDDDDHRMPFSSLPPAEAYPGQALGEPSSGDARFIVRYLEETHLTDDDGYLLVSPRSPYNRVPLPDMALSVAGAADAELTQTLDSEVGFHYGAALEIAAGDVLELHVDGPPQVSRHAGYETAFIDMPPMQVEVPQ